MWFPKTTSNSSIRAGNGQRKGNSIVAVAIDKDKYSQHALKWVVEHLLTRGQTVVLIHVNHKSGNKQFSFLQNFIVLLEIIIDESVGILYYTMSQ